MKQLGKLFGANFKSTFREKQVWFWSIFYPVFLLVIFLTIFGGGGKESTFKVKVAAVMENENTISMQLMKELKLNPVLEWKEDKPVTRSQAEEMLKKKDVDAVIVLPVPAGDSKVGLLLNREKQNSATDQAMNGILKQLITQINYPDASKKAQLQLATDYISSGSNELKYSDFLLTGLIALSISQAGLFGMVGMVEMRRNGLLKRLRMTPVNMKLFGLSNILVRFILSGIIVTLLAIIGVLFYHAKLDINIPTFLIMFTVGTLSFTAIGFMVASLSKTLDGYFGIANMASFIMMFLSGIFFDYATLPDYIKPISNVLPLTYFANGIRDSMVYGLDLFEPLFWKNIGILLAWGAVTFLIGSRFYSWKPESK